MGTFSEVFTTRNEGVCNGERVYHIKKRGYKECKEICLPYVLV